MLTPKENRNEMDMSDMDKITMLSEENARLREAGAELCIAAIRVAIEYDGVHRLMLAVSKFTATMGNQNGRGPATGEAGEGDERMSFECSECERDLRSGHDKACSRYSDKGICTCGHHYDRHDEDLECLDCECDLFLKHTLTPKENR